MDVTIETKHSYAIDEMLRRAWIDPMRAFTDAAHAAREDAAQHGSAPDRMLLLTEQSVVLRVKDQDHLARRLVWLALAPPGSDWSHTRVAARAIAAQHSIAAALTVTMRNSCGTQWLCLVFEHSDGRPLHLRAPVTRAMHGTFIVGDLTATWHSWAEGLAPLVPAMSGPPRTARPARAQRRLGGPHLRLIPGGKS